MQEQLSKEQIAAVTLQRACRGLTMVQKEANLETVIRISIRLLAPSSSTQQRADKTRSAGWLAGSTRQGRQAGERSEPSRAERSEGVTQRS